MVRPGSIQGRLPGGSRSSRTGHDAAGGARSRWGHSAGAGDRGRGPACGPSWLSRRRSSPCRRRHRIGVLQGVQAVLRAALPAGRRCPADPAARRDGGLPSAGLGVRRASEQRRESPCAGRSSPGDQSRRRPWTGWSWPSKFCRDRRRWAASAAGTRGYFVRGQRALAAGTPRRRGCHLDGLLATSLAPGPPGTAAGVARLCPPRGRGLPLHYAWAVPAAAHHPEAQQGRHPTLPGCVGHCAPARSGLAPPADESVPGISVRTSSPGAHRAGAPPAGAPPAGRAAEPGRPRSPALSACEAQPVRPDYAQPQLEFHGLRPSSRTPAGALSRDLRLVYSAANGMAALRCGLLLGEREE